MKGNKQIFSKYKQDRIKGYKKLFKTQGSYYEPPKDTVKDIVEAMSALGFEVTKEEVSAYLKASYAVHDRKFYLRHFRS